MIGKTVSHYRITGTLGGGGMGIVYKAVDTKLGRPVALKFLPPELTRDPDAKRRFVHEAKSASALQHHNICTIHEIDETPDGHVFISMDCYEGETLRQKIARGPLPVKEAVGVACQVAEGLAKAHEAGMVHRDIKPANIVLTNDGIVKILDFGLAKLAGQTRVTKTGTTVGTVAYMSPEQAKGGDIDHRSDIYSLGTVLYEMLTGEVPFSGDHEAAVLYGITHNDPEPLDTRRTDLPEQLQQIVHTALRKEPGERYQNVSEMAADLRRFAGGESTVRGQRSPKGHGRRRIAATGAFLILAVLTGHFIYSHFLRPGVPEPEDGMTTIAVLPFENLGPPEDDYFADGMTEEITARLAGIQELGVIARTSAVQYKNTEKSIEQIGEELGVDYIIEGTVRWQKGENQTSRVRVTPQLIRVVDGTHVWADVYDDALVEIFKIQTDVAKRVVEALNIRLLKHEQDCLTAQPTENVEALDYFMRGNEYFVQRHLEPARRMRTAIQFYERAIAIDSEFASAYAMLAWVYTELYCHREPIEEYKQGAAAAIETAKSLRPTAFDVRLVSGVVDYHFLRYDKAIGELTSLIELHPNNAALLAELAYAHSRKGNWEESIELLSRAVKLDPRSNTTAYELAFRLRLVRRFEEAEVYYDRSIELTPETDLVHIEKALMHLSMTGNAKAARRILDEAANVVEPSSRFDLAREYFDLCAGNYPKSPEECFKIPHAPDRLHWYLSSPDLWGAVLELMGESEQATRYYQLVIDTIENDTQQSVFGFHESMLGIAYAGLGRTDDALAKGRQAVEEASMSAWMKPLSLGFLARIYVITGEYDEAVALLERLLKEPGEMSVPILKCDPRWAALRDHPGFQRMLAQHESTDSRIAD